MNPFSMQIGRENNSFHNNFIESTYLNHIVSSRRILSNVVDILHEQEINLRTILLNNSFQNRAFLDSLNNTANVNNTNIDNNTNATPDSTSNNIFGQSSTFSNRRTMRGRDNEYSDWQMRPPRPFTRREGLRPRYRPQASRPPQRQAGRVNNTENENIISQFLNIANLENELNNNNNNNNILQFDFFAPITVRPTQQQISDATRRIRFSEIENPVNRMCPISQENFNPDNEVIQIRHCRHNFTPQHFNTWFSRNVRCPCCRFDIRNHANNDSSTSNTQVHNPNTGSNTTSNNASVTASNNASNTELPSENNISLDNTVEINVNTPESLNNMISMISNTLAQQLEDSGLDASSNITIQYSISEDSNSNSNSEVREENDANENNTNEDDSNEEPQ